MSLSPREVQLARSVGFDPQIAEFLKSRAKKPFVRAVGLSKDFERAPIDALSFSVKDGREAERVMKKIQPVLLSNGYRACWSTRLDQNGMQRGDEVLVLRTKDHYAIVRMQRTDGANYDISHKAVLAKLRRWERECDFEIVGASHDWVALVFNKLPKDIGAFAEDAYWFCPDAVEQGVGLMRESEHPKVFAAARRLCPRISARTQRLLEEQTNKLEGEASRDPQWRAFLEAVKNSPEFAEGTSTEMGIKLLAYEIYKDKYLFLWWD
jgi:hypothetical protein